jgi:hypothetical protein
LKKELKNEYADHPDRKAIEIYAQKMGMELPEDRRFLSLAEKCMNEQPVAPWQSYRTGDDYTYINYKTNV